jgi:hypothetical protein
MQKDSLKLLVLLVFLVVMLGIVLAQFPKLPKVPDLIPDKIPGLDKILKDEPPVTTNMRDAITEVAFLDDFDPEGAIPLSTLPRTKGGGFILKEPGNYIFESQSYCLKAGTYVRDEMRRGDGYLYAPLKGPKANIVRNILRGSYEHPEIPQGDIQVLLWAIVARTKITDMSRENQKTAAKLLTPKELFELNGGAQALIPEDLMDKAFENIPSPVRSALEAEARLRRKLTEGTATYEELERIAVKFGVPPAEEGDREVPIGRWSYHPDGYFIRYFPRGYKRTVVELYAPDVIQVERDTKGRITKVADTLGNLIETEYDDTAEPLTISGEQSLKGYAFRSIRFERSDPDNPGEKLRIEWKNTGWTLCGVPTGKGKIGASPKRFPGLKERYKQSIRHRKEIQRLDEQCSPTGSINDIINFFHYTTALKEATKGSQEEKWDRNSHINLVRKAWQYDVAKREGGHLLGYAPPARLSDALFASIGSILPLFMFSNPEEDEEGFGLDLSDGAAQPGKEWDQRNGNSGRGSGMDDHCAGEYYACKEQAKDTYLKCFSNCMMDCKTKKEFNRCCNKCSDQFDFDMKDCATRAKDCLINE